jgi:uncharacterized membrane protein
MKRKFSLHLLGAIGLFILGDFWVRYFVFCRFNVVSPFNQFVHGYPLAGDGLLAVMVAAIVSAGVAAFYLHNKLWVSVSFLAVGTVIFIFSQIT